MQQSFSALGERGSAVVVHVGHCAIHVLVGGELGSALER